MSEVAVRVADQPLPKPGQVYIGFSTQAGLLSRFIRWSTGSPASHSFLLFYSEQFQQHMVLEVQGRGFVQVPWTTWMSQNKLLAMYEIDRSSTVIAHAMKCLGAHLGDPYDTYSLVGFLLIFAVPLWDRNDLDSKDKLVCSEMVTLFLRWCDISLNVYIDRVIPRDLWRLADEDDTFIPRYLHPRAERKLPKVRKRSRDLCHEGTPKD